MSEDSLLNRRRKFLQQGAAAAGVSIIPAKSVWGVCNASGVSGGSQNRTETCAWDPWEISGGRSPGTWTKFLTTNPRNTKGLKKIHGMFTQCSSYKYNKHTSYTTLAKLYQVYDHIYNNAAGKTFYFEGTSNGTIYASTFNVLQGLQAFGGSGDHNIPTHLACLYLNLFYGFVSLPAGYSSVDNYMEHVWGVGNVLYNLGSGFGSALDSSYGSNPKSSYYFNLS